MKSSARAKLKPRIVVRKKIVQGRAQHSAWKVAFADFTTAMMAFFLLMWLVQNTTQAQRRAVSGYFVEAGGSLHSGGVSAGLTEDDYLVEPQPSPPGRTVEVTANSDAGSGPQPAPTPDAIQQAYQRRELAALEQLKAALETELRNDQSAFQELKGQIFVDITPLGLRIQIVDRARRPMFDLGSDELKPYTRRVLHALAPLLNRVPNQISVSGHTDSVAFAEGAEYSNWELSVDRANAARRALLEGGYPENKVAAAQGMGAIALFKPNAPTDPANRRIAILVLKKAARHSLLGGDGAPR